MSEWFAHPARSSAWSFVVGVQCVIRCNAEIGVLVRVISDSGKPQSVAHTGDLCDCDWVRDVESVVAPRGNCRPQSASFGRAQVCLSVWPASACAAAMAA